MKQINLYLKGESEKAVEELKEYGMNIQVIIRQALIQKAQDIEFGTLLKSFHITQDANFNLKLLRKWDRDVDADVSILINQLYDQELEEIMGEAE